MLKKVHIKNKVMIEPDTLITTVEHPITPKGRRQHQSQASEIKNGDDI